ncbi:hypothetical protein AB0D13_11130 [Streptomyces sp. NPDC048430]|uniref:hypothetical protein n=1 Tax=Streptomyces sp. NPDC048430 TaxID=3155388 RepID=UPI00343C2C31
MRAVVCDWLAGYPARTPDIADALACLLEHEDRMTRIRAVYGLAERDDPRCVAGYDLIGPVDRELHPDTWELDAVQRYERRLRGRAARNP